MNNGAEQIELHFRVVNKTPIQIALSKTEPTPEQTKGHSYWALSAVDPNYPPVLIHVYCLGELPSEDRRSQLNSAVYDYAVEILTGRRSSAHITE
jgi:hypothetical protein